MFFGHEIVNGESIFTITRNSLPFLCFRHLGFYSHFLLWFPSLGWLLILPLEMFTLLGSILVKSAEK